MANGDIAVTAGMVKVASTADRRQGYDEINKTRDYVATKTILLSTRTAVGKTLIEAASKTAARNAIDAIAAGDAVSPGQVAPADFAVPGKIPTYDGSGRLTAAAPSLSGHVVPLGTLQGGFTTFGEVYLPNAFAAVSGWTICYINSDGRISKGASSERYKKYIAPIVPDTLGDVWPALHRFQMRSLDGTGDGKWRYGWIAERLAESPDLEEFVVYDTQGRPESIDFISLLQVQGAQLHARVQSLEAEVAELRQAVAGLTNPDKRELSSE